MSYQSFGFESLCCCVFASAVELPYSWIVVKPYIRARDPQGEQDVDVPSERIQDVDSAFNIEPDQGSLRASAVTEFTLTFAPPAVQRFHSVLHLVLQGVPKPRDSSRVSDSPRDSSRGARGGGDDRRGDDVPERKDSTQQLSVKRRLSLDSNVEAPMVHIDGRCVTSRTIGCQERQSGRQGTRRPVPSTAEFCKRTLLTVSCEGLGDGKLEAHSITFIVTFYLLPGVTCPIRFRLCSSSCHGPSSKQEMLNWRCYSIQVLRSSPP